MARKKRVDLQDIHGRFLEVVKAKSLTHMDIVDGIGAKSPTVSEWLNHGLVPKGDWLGEFALAFDVNGHWLLTGHGTMDSASRTFDQGVLDAVRRVRRFAAEVENEVSGRMATRADAVAIRAVDATKKARARPATKKQA